MRLQFLPNFKQAKTSKGTDAYRDSLARFLTLGFLGQTIPLGPLITWAEAVLNLNLYLRRYSNPCYAA
jgi:hypothetical protein